VAHPGGNLDLLLWPARLGALLGMYGTGQDTASEVQAVGALACVLQIAVSTDDRTNQNTYFIFRRWVIGNTRKTAMEKENEKNLDYHLNRGQYRPSGRGYHDNPPSFRPDQ
jgi:hypothetical protein